MPWLPSWFPGCPLFNSGIMQPYDVFAHAAKEKALKVILTAGKS